MLTSPALATKAHIPAWLWLWLVVVVGGWWLVVGDWLWLVGRLWLKWLVVGRGIELKNIKVNDM